jgi:hypothetical protein
VLLVGFLYDEIADPPVFGYQTRCRDAYSVEALIAESNRPADGRSRAYPPYLHRPVAATRTDLGFQAW